MNVFSLPDMQACLSRTNPSLTRNKLKGILAKPETNDSELKGPKELHAPPATTCIRSSRFSSNEYPLPANPFGDR